METVLNFFANLILFTGGLLVATFWIIIIVVIIDEAIDLAIKHRVIKSEEDDDE